MTTAIDIRPEMALATPGGFQLEGMEGLGVEDIIVPRWDIRQATSRKTGKTGEFILNLTGECRPTIDAVILRISKTRTLWSKDRAERVPECSSGDGKTGRTYGECVGCKFNYYDDSPGAKVCKAGYTYLCSDPQSPENMFLISMAGSSNMAAKLLNSQFPRRKRHPYTAVVQFQTVEKDTGKGLFYAHQPVITAWMEEQEYAPFRDISRMMLGVAIREVEPNVVAEATGQTPQQVPAVARQAPPAQASHQASAPQGHEPAIPTSDITWEQLTGEDPAPSGVAASASPVRPGNGGKRSNLPF